MKEVVIVSAVRTAIGSFGGALKISYSRTGSHLTCVNQNHFKQASKNR